MRDVSLEVCVKRELSLIGNSTSASEDPKPKFSREAKHVIVM